VSDWASSARQELTTITVISVSTGTFVRARETRETQTFIICGIRLTRLSKQQELQALMNTASKQQLSGKRILTKGCIMGEAPPDCPLPWGHPGSHVINGYGGPPEFTIFSHPKGHLSVQSFLPGSFNTIPASTFALIWI